MIKRNALLYLLMFICLGSSTVAFGQAEDKKVCSFNLVGTWKLKAATPNPILFRFAPDGTVTLLSRSTEIADTDFEMLAAVKYKLDKPTAPTQLDIIAVRGNEVFGRGTTSMQIAVYDDNSFTTINPSDGRRAVWVRAKTNRYFLTFAARGVPVTGYSDDSSTTIDPKNGRPTLTTYGGPAFAMWTKLDGRKTEVETLGLNLVTDGAGRMVPVVGSIPVELYREFTKESSKDSDVMIRLELTEAEFERTRKVFKTWDKRVREKTLLYDDPYLNVMEFLRRTAESLNQCSEKLQLHKLTWLENDQIVTKHNIPQHPLEYIRVMRKKNDQLHVTDERFPKDWRPTSF
jgi:hypothetical protein